MTDMLGPLVTFALVTTITPGPDNVMLTASGANFGFRRTIPHMLGIAAPTTADTARTAGRPLTFLQAALFQWVNPKGWMMAVGAISAYATVGGDLVQETFVPQWVLDARIGRRQWRDRISLFGTT